MRDLLLALALPDFNPNIPSPKTFVILNAVKDLLLALALLQTTTFLYPRPMPREHFYTVYLLSSRSRTLYLGVTNSLLRRVQEHRDRTAESFTARYRIDRLVHFERFRYVNNAIAREKVLKGWLRERKIALIEARNPTWTDLYPELAAGTLDEKQIIRYAHDDKPEE